MKIISKTILISTILIFFFSCNKEETKLERETEVSENKISELVKSKLNLIKVTNKEKSTYLNSTKKHDIKMYKSIVDNSYMVVNNVNNKYYLKKGKIINNKFVTKSNFELIDNMDDNGNGNLIIKNLNENVVISQNYQNKKFINNIISKPTNFSRRGLCQREAGESFSDCNKRETDEFCDDFISTVAYITNPQIAILIAGLCSC